MQLGVVPRKEQMDLRSRSSPSTHWLCDLGWSLFPHLQSEDNGTCVTHVAPPWVSVPSSVRGWGVLQGCVEEHVGQWRVL